jgi:hypothetical protein
VNAEPLAQLGEEYCRRLFEHVTEPWEGRGGDLGLRHDDWARLTAVCDRLAREGMSAATELELAWLRDLEERTTYALARALVVGPGRDRAIVQARLTDAYRRRCYRSARADLRRALVEEART